MLPPDLEYFAKLIENDDGVKIVSQVVVVGKPVLVDEQGNQLEFPESEPVGQQFLISLYGPSEWRQTDYHLPITYRERTAKIGGTYDEVNDVFVDPVIDDSDIQSSQLF